MKRQTSRRSSTDSPPKHQPATVKLTPAGLDEGDVSLIRWMLELTPGERLEVAQDFADSMAALRNAREVSH